MGSVYTSRRFEYASVSLRTMSSKIRIHGYVHQSILTQSFPLCALKDDNEFSHEPIMKAGDADC